MNGKPIYAFRIVLGGYLAYLGVKLIYQMIKVQPTNMLLTGIMGAVFAIVGGSYAIYSLKKLIDIRKEERGEEVYGTDDFSAEPEKSGLQNEPKQLDLHETLMKEEAEQSDGSDGEDSDSPEEEEDIPEDEVKNVQENPQEELKPVPDDEPREEMISEEESEPEEEIETDYEER